MVFSVSMVGAGSALAWEAREKVPTMKGALEGSLDMDDVQDIPDSHRMEPFQLNTVPDLPGYGDRALPPKTFEGPSLKFKLD